MATRIVCFAAILLTMMLSVHLSSGEPTSLPPPDVMPPRLVQPKSSQDPSSTDLKTRDARSVPIEAHVLVHPELDATTIDALWSLRHVRLPRLAANLVLDSVPMQRPLPIDYQIKPGDRLRIVVWGGQSINEVIPVLPNGDVAVPGLGFVPVAGRNIVEAQASILELVRSHYRQGGVVVAVEQPQQQAVTVVGEVLKPGYLSLPPGGTILEALSAAGGILARGSLRRISVHAPGQQPYEIDLYRIALEGDTSLLAPLPANSVIFVPLAGPQVQVFGAVHRRLLVPSSTEPKPMSPESLAVSQDGTPEPGRDATLKLGPMPSLTTERVAPRSSETGAQRTSQAGSSSSLSPPSKDPGPASASPRAPSWPTQPAQISGTSEPSNLTAMQRTVEHPRRHSGANLEREGIGCSVELLPNERLSEAIRLAGGYRVEADLAHIRLLREEPQGQELRTLQAAELATMVAQDGDRLFVPSRRDLGSTSRTIAIRGAVLRPGTYPHRDGMTVKDAIEAAGGLLPQGDPRSVTISRLLPEPEVVLENRVPIVVGYAQFAGVELGMALRPLDIILVPERNPPDPTLAGVTIEGAVVNPGRYPFTPGMTVRDLLVQAGMLLPHALATEAYILRTYLDDTGSMSVSYLRTDLREIVERQSPGAALHPGDTLVVRSLADRRIRVTLRGEFRTTGTFTLPAGSTVADAVRMSGGIMPEAFPRGMRLYRQSEAEAARQFLADLTQRVETAVTINRRAALEADEESKAEAERDLARQEALLLQMRRAQATGRLAGIDFACILAGTCKDELVLQDGDVLELPARPGTIRVIGEVMSPGSLAFVPELSVKEMIRRSGGYTRQADREAVFVVRADGSVVATAQGDTMAWDYERRRWARTTLSSLKLEEGDTVIVPADLRYKDSNRRIIRDWTQIMFQIAATVGTIAVVAK